VASAVYNIPYQQGADYRQTFTFYDPAAEGASATPTDFTDFTARMQVRTVVHSDEVMVDLSTENGMITLGADGTLVLHIPIEEAEGIVSEGVYDLYVTSGETGEPNRLMEGLFRFYPAVTRV
jgi:hypothetical protein